MQRARIAPRPATDDHRSNAAPTVSTPRFRSEKPWTQAREPQRRHYHARLTPQLEEVIDEPFGLGRGISACGCGRLGSDIKLHQALLRAALRFLAILRVELGECDHHALDPVVSCAVWPQAHVVPLVVASANRITDRYEVGDHSARVLDQIVVLKLVRKIRDGAAAARVASATSVLGTAQVQTMMVTRLSLGDD
jgi:hypothetical protein